MAKSKSKTIEMKAGKPLEQVLVDAYERLGNQTAVARSLGVSQGTVSLWLVRLGLREKTIVVRREQAG